MLQWTADNGLSDNGFEKLLKILKKKLPKDNELPDSIYAAKKVVCPLGFYRVEGSRVEGSRVVEGSRGRGSPRGRERDFLVSKY